MWTGKVTAAIRCLLLLAIAAAAPVAAAGSWQAAPSLSLTTEYTSNPQLSSASGGGLWRGILQPALLARWSDGRDSLDAGGQLHLERSSDAARSLDREDPSLSLKWLRPGERDQLALDAAYREAATRAVRAEDPGLAGLAEDATRRALRLGGNWQRDFAPRLTLQLGAGLGRVRYDVPELKDYQETKAFAGLSYAWSARTDLTLRATSGRYDPAGEEPDTEVYGLSLGAAHRSGPRLEWRFEAGGSAAAGGGAGNGWQGSAGVSYRSLRSEWGVEAGRSLEASGAGGVPEVDHLTLSMSRRLSEMTRFSVTGSARRSRGAVVAESERVSLGLSRALSPHWSAQLGYRFERASTTGAPAAEGHAVALSLAFSDSVR